MKPTIRFEPSDERGFARARKSIIRDYEASLQSAGVVPDLFIAQLMLEYRWGYGDGRILWWTVPDIEGFLLDFVPRKTALTDTDADQVPEDMQRFVSWLHRNHLLGGDSIQKLGRAITNATPDFRRAMHGTGRSGFSPAKALVGAMRSEGLDPTDPDQLGRFLDAFNARPQAERDEILGWEDDLDLDLEPGEDDDDEPEPDDGPMPAIELPSVPELATMAEATVTFRQLRTVRDFLETPRRLTQAGNLSLADARTLATHLGLEHRFDPVFHGRQEKTRSVMDIPELDRVFRWAIHARFGEVDRNRAELGPNADLFEESPQEAWLLAMVMLLNGKVLDGDLGWAPFEEPLVDLVEELPAQLYPYGAARIEQLETVAVRLLEEERDLDPPGGPFDLRREIVKALPRRVLEPLTELGVIAIEDGSVSLTPLGR
jgi:hypothetical protein